MKGNLLIVHSGGPTAVINASLYGVLKEARKHEEIEIIYGAISGVTGILNENFVDLRNKNEDDIGLLPQTPGSVLGLSRQTLYESDYRKIVLILKKYNIKYLLYTGGNGSMDTCNKIFKAVNDDTIKVIGIPKTVDNDIYCTDHCPGYGSAAKFVATCVAEIGKDIESLPQVTVIEVMGRNAGWLAAASILARKKHDDAPHLVCLPERPFIIEKFLSDVKILYREIGGAVIVVSEGLVNEKGELLIQSNNERNLRDRLGGDVGAYIAWQVIDKLGIKARSEKPGLLGRNSIELQSLVDRNEAIEVGRFAVEMAIKGKTGYMVSIKRLSDEPYEIQYELVSLEDVALIERKVPDIYIDSRGNNVSDAFKKYCKPLIGGELPVFAKSFIKES